MISSGDPHVPQLPALPHAGHRGTACRSAGRVQPERSRAINLPRLAARSRGSSSIPVLCTGGFQTASIIRAAIESGDCDAVTIARPLVANNDLVEALRGGARPRRRALHVLQQVPLQRGREPAGLLRRAALRLARGDDRADPVGLRPAAVRGAAGGDAREREPSSTASARRTCRCRRRSGRASRSASPAAATAPRSSISGARAG